MSLAIIQVGNNPASNVYIRNKRKAIEAAGMESIHIWMDSDATTNDVIDAINDAVESNAASAVMVQLPLPGHIDKDAVLRAIPPEKDIDGLNPKSDYKPLTPCAIMRWLHERYDTLRGKTVTILGRSELVGKPLAMMLIDEGATVISCNSRTHMADLSMFCTASDIIVSAAGHIGAVPRYYADDKQVIIDVGINRDVNGKLCGDVGPSDRKLLEESGVEITPVPGGVGKWTVQELVLRLKEMEGIECA